MRWKHGVLLIVLAPLSLLTIGVAVGFATFVDDRVTEGTAYGFRIGESAAESYDIAKRMLEHGGIHEFRVGRGSAATLLDPSSQDPTTEVNWKLVVDREWWNNSISLRFENQRLVEIHRFRLCCELP